MKNPIKMSAVILFILSIILASLFPATAVSAQEPEETQAVEETSETQTAETTQPEEYRDYVYVPQSCGVVLSEDIVEGHSLRWEARWFFDTLTAVDDENLHITYEYNADGLRTSKTENGVTTSYEYNGEYYLTAQTCGEKRIDFVYDEKVFGPKPYKGFYYENEYYEYSYDENGVIDGLNLNGAKIVLYTYDGRVPNGVYGIDESGNYTDKTGDGAFIGNINPIRYTQRYYEKALNWYYGNGRYYSPQEGRYIDGISEERAAELAGVYSDFELMVKTYTFGLGVPDTDARMEIDDKGRIHVGNLWLFPKELVTLVIFKESSLSAADQDCVAWVIENRIADQGDFRDVGDAVSVVLQKDQFAVLSQIEKMTTYQEDPTNNLFVHAALLADELVTNKCHTSAQKPSWFTDQLNFFSVESFMQAVVIDNTIVKYPDTGGWITYDKCAIVPEGAFTYYELQYGLIDLSQYAKPKIYNVFCTATYH